jgi:hypothetical protein
MRVRDAAVLLTRTELAWFLARNDYLGQVAVYRRRRVRIVSRSAAIRPGLEDGRTLRWSDYTGYYSFFDLRPVPCRRSRFTRVLRTDRVDVTRRVYGPAHNGVMVIRACDLATQRDVVVAQQQQLGGDGTLDVVGADRTWVMTVATTIFSTAPTTVELAWADAATGRAWGPRALEKAGPPHAGAFTVTDRGIPAWLDGDRLVRLSNYDTPELDRGAISDLHAAGDAVMWTRDGI